MRLHPLRRTRPYLLVVLSATALAVGGCSMHTGVVPVPEAASSASEYTTMTSVPPQTHTPDASPVPPGAALDISAMQPVPGEAFDFNLCTVAWSFVLDDARTIAVTASHCGEPGDTVWAGAADGEFVYPSEPVGTIIYSDLSSPDTHQLDFALVEITRQAEFYVPQDMPTNVASAGRRSFRMRCASWGASPVRPVVRSHTGRGPGNSSLVSERWMPSQRALRSARCMGIPGRRSLARRAAPTTA